MVRVLKVGCHYRTSSVAYSWEGKGRVWRLRVEEALERSGEERKLMRLGKQERL